MVVFDLLLDLFRVTFWPSVGNELIPWLFTCFNFSAVLYVSLSRLVFRAKVLNVVILFSRYVD